MKKSSRYRAAGAVLQNFRKLRVTVSVRHVNRLFIELFPSISLDKRRIQRPISRLRFTNNALRKNKIVYYQICFREARSRSTRRESKI